MAGICIIKEVHLCMPCIPTAEVKMIVELHLQAEPLPGNGWGGLRAISIEDQPRLRQQFPAIWWDFFWSQPTPFGQCSPQMRMSVTATVCRHCDKHCMYVISFDPSNRFEKVYIIFYRGGDCNSNSPSHLLKLLIDLGIFYYNGLPSIFKGLVFLKKSWLI